MDNNLNSNLVRELLLPFHSGNIDEKNRLRVERELFIDPELLTEYLDLKREAEGARELPIPSPKGYRRLLAQIPQRKKFFLSLSVGAAIAAGVFFFLYLHSAQQSGSSGKNSHEILFDSNREPSVTANVL